MISLCISVTLLITISSAISCISKFRFIESTEKTPPSKCSYLLAHIFQRFAFLLKISPFCVLENLQRSLVFFLLFMLDKEEMCSDVLAADGLNGSSLSLSLTVWWLLGSTSRPWGKDWLICTDSEWVHACPGPERVLWLHCRAIWHAEGNLFWGNFIQPSLCKN